MNVFNKLETFVLIAICLVSLVNVINCNFADESIKKSQAVLASSKEVFSNLNEVIQAINPGKLFAKLSTVLGALGPAAMAISAVLSIVSMFLPKEDSPELKAIKAGFEKVNNKLDIITSKIGNLENIIELSSARAAYVKTVTNINNNYKALEDAQRENTKEGYQFFAKQYENSFEFATENIYDAMTGSTGPFGFNMVNLYKTNVKCNPVRLSQFCTMGISLINKGLTIEGAYIGYLNFSSKAEAKAESWKVKIDALMKQCSSLIESCENSWKDYGYQQFKDTYRELGGDNQKFAEKIAQDLNNVVPQRSWLAVVYNDASGFGEHTYSSYYETEKVWDQKDHDVTIFSTPRQEELTGSNLENLIKPINEQKNKIFNTNECGSSRLRNNEARRQVETIREKFSGGVVYAVFGDKRPGHAATGNNMIVSDQKWKCNNYTYRIIIFI